MAAKQDLLDDTQGREPPLLMQPGTVKGVRFHVGYEAPFAVRGFSGFLRIEPAASSFSLVFAYAGSLKPADGSGFEAAPFIGSLGTTWISSADARGWVAAFHPSVINQEFAKWPTLPGKVDSDPFLKRDLELLRAVMPSKGGGSGLDRLLLSNEEDLFMRRVFSSMEDLLENQRDIYWPCRSRSYFLEALLFLWQRPAPIDAEVPRKPARLAQEWLRSNYAEDISVPGLASRFGTNRTSLQEQFRAEFGRTVMDYLGDIRTEAATILMRNTELSLAEICDRVGFADYSNFYREFRKRRGASPQRYRDSALRVRIY
jgi:AraC-like DNA-binding protein